MRAVNFSFEEILEIKNAGVPKSCLEALRRDADAEVAGGTYKATERKQKAPSGDPHDYMSMGPYWWPNPDTPDGLPYIRRDGKVNPETTEFHAGTLYTRIQTLALAALYLGDDVYSEFAEKQLYDWFINPETKMNPNARYAQCVPGRCDGRSTGLIDFGIAHRLFDGLVILEGLGKVKPETLEGIKSWYNEFIDWMLTHEMGLEADNSDNNGGDWYDAHVLSAAVWLGRPALVQKICTTAYTRRFLDHISEDGSMPRELARTKGMGYTLYALDALLTIANIAERHGYTEYWGIDGERGHCVIKQAFDYIYPYVKDPSSFPYSELYPDSHGGAMYRSFISVNKRYPKEGYDKKAEEFKSRSGYILSLLPIR